MSGDERYEPQRRIRIGLTGLAFVFLLVLLGTAISRSGEDGVPPADNLTSNAEVEPNEPLAEIGAAPGQSESEQQAERDANAAVPK